MSQNCLSGWPQKRSSRPNANCKGPLRNRPTQLEIGLPSCWNFRAGWPDCERDRSTGLLDCTIEFVLLPNCDFPYFKDHVPTFNRSCLRWTSPNRWRDEYAVLTILANCAQPVGREKERLRDLVFRFDLSIQVLHVF